MLRMSMLACFVFVAMTGVALGQTTSRWLYLEASELDGDCAALSECLETPLKTSRQALRMNADAVDAFLGVLAQRADMTDLPDMRSPTVMQCTVPSDELTDELQTIGITEQAGSLKGLTEVYFDARRVKGPDGTVDSVGVILHERFIAQFQALGIRVLTEEEAAAKAGAALLSITFSPMRDDRGCVRPFRAALQLKQSVSLTRDVTVRVMATTWSKAIGQAFNNSNLTAEIAMLETVDAFVADWLRVNRVTEVADSN